jgi:hypothetical protein
VVQTGNLRYDPVRWDDHICHTYWRTGGGGNVARTIWEGDEPPPPPPPVTGLICDPGTFTNCRIETRP